LDVGGSIKVRMNESVADPVQGAIASIVTVKVTDPFAMSVALGEYVAFKMFGLYV